MKIISLYGTVGWQPEDMWLHSAGASLWIDGKHISTISEERLSREKHDGNYPELSIDYVLNEGELKKEDIDVVVYVHNVHSTIRERVVSDILSREFSNAEVEFVDHHRSHVSACFYTSPFSKASILSLDGAGNSFEVVPNVNLFETGMYGIGDKKKGITILHHAKNGFKNKPFEFNLGQVYNNISRYIYEQIEPKKAKSIENPYIFMETAPGKVMGLAGYGDHEVVDLGMLFKVVEDFYFPVIVDNYYPSESEMGKYDPEDIAAWLQNQFENIIIEYFQKLDSKFKEKNLCLSGGCGLNVLLNRRLLDENIFDDIHVFPATNDSGLCFGGAISKVVEKEKKYEIPEHLAYFGKEYSDEEIERVIHG